MPPINNRLLQKTTKISQNQIATTNQKKQLKAVFKQKAITGVADSWLEKSDLSQKFENIREAKKTDIPELVKAIKDGYESAYISRHYGIDQQVIDTVNFEQIILKSFQVSKVFVYESEGEITGFTAYADSEEWKEVYKLYLKKKFQKQGIGTALLKYLIYHLHDNSELRVFAYSCNKAISFYEKFGFEHQVKLLGKYPFAPGLMAKTRGYSLNSSQIIKIKNCINKQLSSPKVAQGQEG